MTTRENELEHQRAASRRHYAAHREQEIARVRRWTVANMHRVKANSVLRRSKKLPPAQVLFNNAKMRAKAQGVPFSISVTDIVVPAVCPVLDIALVVQTGHARDNSPSLDRIDPVLGYVRGNVQVISHKANTIKSNASLDDIERVYHWLLQRRQ